MMRFVVLGALVLIVSGLVLGFTSSTTPIQEESVQEPQDSSCDGVSVGDAGTNVSVNESELTVEGVYCASSGGHNVMSESIEENGDSIEATVMIESPEGIATTVMSPVEYNISEDLVDGSYDVDYEVLVDDELIESGSESIQIGGSVESSSVFRRLSSWFSNLF